MKVKMRIFIFCLITILIIVGYNTVNASSTTLLNLEFPNTNYAHTSLNIGGWAMSIEENTSVRIYFNNEEITDIKRSSRADVITAVTGYGDATVNPTPGFEKELDLTNYKDGKYTLVVQVVNENNQVLEETSKVIEVKKYESIMTVEEPSLSVVGTNITIGGWVMSTNPNATARVYIDNEEITGINRYHRQDVINAVKGYGGFDVNPQSGFKTTIDATNYSDGKHNITVQLYDVNTDEIMEQYTSQITLEKYKYKVNLESPSSNVVRGTELKVNGWLMASSDVITVRASIDDIALEEFSRIKRADVLKAVTGYGDATVNPTPGFEQIVDLSSFDDGIHHLKIEVINNSTNEVLEEINRNIVLEKYRSLLNVEEPSIANVTGNSLVVGGWLMSVNEDAQIQVFLDNDEIVDVTRSRRNDVLSAISDYGDATVNPTPGFKATIDLSAIKDGTHTIKVRVIDANTNSVMIETSKTIHLDKYRSRLTVEEPSTSNITTSLKVTGWVMTTDANASVKVLLDDAEYENIKRTNRNDVLNAISGYGGKDINPTPGFETTIDTTVIKDGTHTVTVRVVDDLTGEILAESRKTITVKKYEGIGVIESPDSVSTVDTTLSMTGWLMTSGTDYSLKIYIDNGEVSDYQVKRTNRNDVLNAISGYGGKNTNPTPGYSISCDMSGYADGIHTLELRVVDNKTNDIITTAKKNITLKKYDGIIHLETPTRSLFNTGFTISGWEMSELDNSYIKVYLDGKDMNLTVERSPRGDVISSVTGYGDETVNATPGFSTYLDLSNISTGDHILTVRLYSKLNEQITEITKKIVVYNNVYFGVDVSYYQGNINWSTVKKEGIDFAVVRLGFRGYGTGSLNLDLQYQNNIRGVIQNDIDLGLYFYSQAITEQEAIEEANYVLSNISLSMIGDQITYPIVFDTEFTEARPNGRADNLTKEERTKVAKAFLDTIKNAGYTPMIYASKSFLYDNLDMNVLSEYDVWVAHYNNTTDPVNNGTDYTGAYHMWQYTSSGTVSGINGTVDLDISYKKY